MLSNASVIPPPHVSFGVGLFPGICIEMFTRLYIITRPESGTLGVNLPVVSNNASHPVLQ